MQLPFVSNLLIAGIPVCRSLGRRYRPGLWDHELGPERSCNISDRPSSFNSIFFSFGDHSIGWLLVTLEFIAYLLL